MIVDGVCVIVENAPMSQEEISYYIDHLRTVYRKLRLRQLTLRRGNGYVNLRCSFEGNPLQRLWRFELGSNGHGRVGVSRREEGAS